jgi:S1-C subfamily serine protease
MNLLLPFLLLSIALMVPHQASAADIYKDTGEVLVLELASNSPASEAGIKVGDYILNINNNPIRNVTDYEQVIAENISKEITISIKHSDGTTADIKLTPRAQAPHEGHRSSYQPL